MQTQPPDPFGALDSFEAFFEQAESRPGYWIELAKLENERKARVSQACESRQTG
jgi:hypothetical protein